MARRKKITKIMGKKNKIKTVKRKEVTNFGMLTGGEKKYTKIIIDGVVKEWVGIGWVSIDDEPDTNKYPVLID